MSKGEATAGTDADDNCNLSVSFTVTLRIAKMLTLSSRRAEDRVLVLGIENLTLGLSH